MKPTAIRGRSPRASRRGELSLWLFVVLCLIHVTPAVAVTTWHVDDDAPNDPQPDDPLGSDPAEDGTTSHPFDAIQEAINVARHGDTVMVADGVYTGPGNLAMKIGPGVGGLPGGFTLRSANGPLNCIIDGTLPPGWTYSRFIYLIGGLDQSMVIDGFTIRNGSLNIGSGAAIAVSNSSPVIRNCIMTHNTTGNSGGAIFCHKASPRIENCTMTDNTAAKVGGAIFCEQSSCPTLIGCTISGNRAVGSGDTFGGAIYLQENSDAWIQGCEISNNQATYGGGIRCRFSEPWIVDCDITGNVAAIGGGGIHAFNMSATIEDCRILNNSATWGAGIWAENANPIIRNCSITDNTTAQGFGGGVLCYPNSSPLISGCLIARNVAGAARNGNYAGGGVSCDTNCYATIVNCTFKANKALGSPSGFSAGGGLHCSISSPSVTNCLFSGNVAGDLAQQQASGGAINYQLNGTALTVTNCTFVGNQAIGTVAAKGGGIRGVFGTATITNCILWFNQDDGGMDESAQIERQTTTPAVNWNSVQGWTGVMGGSGNIGLDPNFVDADGTDNTFGTDDDNPRLAAGSPCIDAANNDADIDMNKPGVQPLTPVDLDTRFRRADDPTTADTGLGTPPIVDMGAFEFGSTSIPARLFVDQGALGINNGTSWSDAFTELRDAMDVAALSSGPVNEIWVAGGVYKPTAGNDRSAAFRLVSSVAVYGGFTSGQTSLGDRDPDPLSNNTILSGDIGAPGDSSDNSYHAVISAAADATAILDGFTITDGNANGSGYLQGVAGGILSTTTGATVSNCRVVANAAASGGGIYFDRDDAATAGMVIDANSAPSENGGAILRSHLDLQTDLALTTGTFRIESSWFTGPGAIQLGQDTLLKITTGESLDMPPTVIQTDVQGPGDIVIDFGKQLVIGGNAVVDLGREPGDQCGSAAGGQITINGALIVRDSAAVTNATLCVNEASFGGNNQIQFNDIRLLEASKGFGGQLFVEDGATVSDNRIVSEGDRYLDLDPDPQANPRPVIQRNMVEVMIKSAEPVERGTLLELRALDHDCGTAVNPDCASGAFHAPASSGFTTDPSENWVLEKLEITQDAKLNLTNRPGFQFQTDTTHPETVYVKNLILHPNAVLNTGLQTLYYQNLKDENDNTLDPDNLPGGRKIVNEPLLGFSLVSIAMNDQTEFDVRLRSRVLDDPTLDPTNPATPLGSVTRLPDGLVVGDGLMEMRTLAAGRQVSATSVAAKGAFTRAGDEDITIIFQYLFQANPDAELVVYLSDRPNVGEVRVEVARVRMPPSGRPGSIGSGQFATFFGKFPRGALNFTRGTHVELELRGDLDANGNTIPPVASRVWIDNFDPKITACCSCGDLNFNGCTADSQDYLVLLAEYGQSLGQASDAKKACLDQVYGGDHYVDLMDLLGWDSVMDADHPPPNACNIGIARADGSAVDGTAGDKDLPPPHPLTGSADQLLIAGKPNQPGQQFDYVYSIAPNAACVGSAQLPAGADSADPTSRSNGRLIQDKDGNIYQLHGALGLLRTGAELVAQRRVIPPRSFSITGGTLYVGIHDVVVNEDPGSTPPLVDVAFGRTESTKDFAYVVPAMVIPQNTSECPYRVAAKLQLERGANGVFNGNYNLITLYGQNPTTYSTTSSSFCAVGQPTDVQHQREVEIDASGNLFVLAAQALSPNNDWLLIYNESTGNTSEKRVPLSVPSPTALLWSATDNKLYLTSSINSIPDPNNNNRPGGDVDVFSYNVPDVLAYTPPAPPAPQVGVTPNATTRIMYPVSGDLGFGYVSTITSLVENACNLYALGFTMPRFDPNISPNNSVFNGVTGTINAAPALAVIDINTNQVAGQPAAINCNNLGLPVSMIYTAGTLQPDRSITHWRSVRTHGAGTDLSIELNPLATGNGSTGPTVETRQGGIQKIEVEFNGAVTLASAASITVTGPGSPTYTASTTCNTLTINFTGGMSDQACYTITIGPAALSQTVTGNTTCRIRSLQGDGTGNGSVNLGDAIYTKKKIGQTADVFPNLDYNLTGGTIDTADMLAVKPLITSPPRKALCP